MQRLFKIVCRGSRLSLAQADIVKRKLLVFDPTMQLEIVIKETQGDLNQSVPLQELEGKDFFTKDIQDFLLIGQADFAVHSLKDVSGDFFNGNHFALIERDDPRDVAVFNNDVFDKVSKGLKLKVGTSSPRRATMATDFLLKTLPRVNEQEVNVEAVAIRGNVDTRLQKLTNGDYDGIILACAGLNRLLQADQGKYVEGLLKEKVIMILPLLHCPPAPGQGAIVAETSPSNVDAVKILQAINDKQLAQAVVMERKIAQQYGSGCHQQFGAVHINNGDHRFIYAAGKDKEGNSFTEIFSEDGIATLRKQNPVAVDSGHPLFAQQNIQLIANQSELMDATKRIWVAKTETWFELAKMGFWIEGSLEGLGSKFNEPTLTSPLVNFYKSI
jgi:hydroxymethylbilane synthase